MKCIFLLSLLLSLSACSGGGGSSSSKDPIIGNTYFVAFSSGNNYLLEATKFSSPNKFHTRSGVLNSVSGNFLYQENTGTFIRSGNLLIVTFQSRTCPGDTTETYEINGDESDFLTVKLQGSSTSFNFWNDKKYTITGLTGTSISTHTEDTGCTLF